MPMVSREHRFVRYEEHRYVIVACGRRFDLRRRRDFRIAAGDEEPTCPDCKSREEADRNA